MKKFKNLIILGTSHISKQSIKEVKTIITQEEPDIIAIELDLGRFKALTQKQRKAPSILKMGPKIYLLNLIGAYIEKKLGRLVKTKPGSEMKIAINIATKNKTSIALIDQDIRITLKRLIKAITWKEKFNFITDLIKSPFKKEEIKFDLNKVPSEAIIQELISKTKDRYPSFYNVLIEERNIFMAKNLYNLMTKYNDKKIFVIVGAGHQTEIINIIKKIKGEPKSKYVLLKPKYRTL